MDRQICATAKQRAQNGEEASIDLGERDLDRKS
jgi:hypothetical protein